MAVYVDQPLFPFRGELWCHMWADRLPELQQMAAWIGLRRFWLQEPPKATWTHYDLSPGRRILALRHGAIETDKYGPIAWRAAKAGDDKTLARIFRLRCRNPERVHVPEIQTAAQASFLLPFADTGAHA